MGIYNGDAEVGFGAAQPLSPMPPKLSPEVRDLMESYGLSQAEAEQVIRKQFGIGPGYQAPGSGGGSVVSPTDEWNMAFQEKKFAADQQWNEAEAKRKQLESERDWALATGDRELAIKKQQSADYWQGVQASLEKDRLAVQSRGQDMDYAVGMANVQARKYESDNSYKIGMANAQNDAERNAITAKWNAEQAQIAKMEDETRRLLGTQENQTNQWQAETDRAYKMGTLGLENNKFILEASTQPRNMPSLFFMQRGLAPDWNAMENGQPLAQGAPLVPSKVMDAFIPTTAAPTFNGQPVQNEAAAKVGSFVGSGTTNANPFIKPLDQSGGSSGGGAFTAPTFAPFQSTTQVTGPGIKYDTPFDYNAGKGGTGNGVPLANMKPGMNVSTVGGDTPGSAFTIPAYYDQGKTRPVLPGDNVAGGTQVWLDYQPERKADGGPTMARWLMTGDAPAKDPNAGGARPELIHNPTGAPLEIIRNPKTTQWMQQNPQQAQRAQEWLGGMPQMQRRPMQRMSPMWGWMAPQQVRRFALGTDSSGAYNAAGMGSYYLPDSENTHLDGKELSPWLQRLKDAKFGIAPSLFANATGGVAPTWNMQGAANQRGLGTLTSLQGLGRQSKSETELYRGYLEGPGGVPFADIVDWLGRPTQHLRGAQQARAV